MKKNNNFTLMLTMHSHLSLLTDLMINKLAFVLSLKQALDKKDELSEDERFSDQTFETQDKFNSIYLNSLKGTTSSSKALVELLLSSEIIPYSLLEDIQQSLAYKEENQIIEDTIFNPFNVNKESLSEAKNEFLFRIVYLFRILHHLKDIEIGMQEYGVECYKVPEEESEDSINILDGIYDMDENKLKEEVMLDCILDESETDQLQQEKNEILSLI